MVVPEVAAFEVVDIVVLLLLLPQPMLAAMKATRQKAMSFFMGNFLSGNR